MATERKWFEILSKQLVFIWDLANGSDNSSKLSGLDGREAPNARHELGSRRNVRKAGRRLSAPPLDADVGPHLR